MNARARVLSVVTPLALGVAFFGLWEWLVVSQDIKPYLLPKPSAIWEQITLNWQVIWPAMVATGTNALIGLVAGTLVAVVAAFVASRFKLLGEMTAPVAIAVNAMPIIGLAAIFNIIFDSTTSVPRRLVVTLVVMFPVFVNVLKGLTQVDPVHAELMRSYAASDTVILRKVRVPNALSYLFVGLRLAASLCVISAVVAEYFGGLQNGLGNKITSAAANSNFPRAWAFVAAACWLGLAFFLVGVAAERAVTGRLRPPASVR